MKGAKSDDSFTAPRFGWVHVLGIALVASILVGFVSYSFGQAAGPDVSHLLQQIKTASGASVDADADDVIDLAATVLDGAITTIKLANLAVTTPKISDEAVTTPKIADNAVDSAKIADNSIVNKKVSDSAVSTSKIEDNAITSSKISGNAVTSSKILDGEIKTQDLANASVTPQKLSESYCKSDGTNCAFSGWTFYTNNAHKSVNDTEVAEVSVYCDTVQDVRIACWGSYDPGSTNGPDEFRQTPVDKADGTNGCKAKADYTDKEDSEVWAYVTCARQVP
ncbi:MAG: hypothetical protein HY393_01485 [Candidatus Diapherotrites archaeon]|nr:hypothetical protein [Candidatus Diapherotrites archaeon]